MKLRITVQNKAYDVEVEVMEEADGSAPVAAAPAPVAQVVAPVAAAPAPRAAAPAPVASAGGKVFPAPLAGTVRGIKVKVGDSVNVNDEIIMLEAMKMETSVSAAYAGRIKAILVNVGDAVQSGQGLVEFE